MRYPPHKRGISAILARYPMKTRQMGAIPPLPYYLERVLQAMGGGGGILRWAAKLSVENKTSNLSNGPCFILWQHAAHGLSPPGMQCRKKAALRPKESNVECNDTILLDCCLDSQMKRLSHLRCFSTPPSMRNRRSQLSANSMVFLQILVNFQSISIDFLSFSISFSQLQSVLINFNQFQSV